MESADGNRGVNDDARRTVDEPPVATSMDEAANDDGHRESRATVNRTGSGAGAGNQVPADTLADETGVALRDLSLRAKGKARETVEYEELLQSQIRPELSDGRNPQDALEIVIEGAARRVRLPTMQGFARGVGGAMFVTCGFFLSVVISSDPRVSHIVAILIFPLGFLLVHLLFQELATGLTLILYCGLRAHRQTYNITPDTPNLFVQKFVSDANELVAPYQNAGVKGFFAALVQGIFCNWCVGLGTFLVMMAGTINVQLISMWIPISIFFGLGGQHIVINSSALPTALIFIHTEAVTPEFLATLCHDTANPCPEVLTFTNTLVWNWIPVLLGNLLGGIVLGEEVWHMFHTKKPKEK